MNPKYWYIRNENFINYHVFEEYILLKKFEAWQTDTEMDRQTDVGLTKLSLPVCGALIRWCHKILITKKYWYSSNIYIYSMQLLTTCITIQFLHCFTDLFINVYDLFISETSFCYRHKDRVSVQASGLTVRIDMELVWDKTRQQSLSKDFDNIDTGIETLFTPSSNTYKWQLPVG